MINYLKIWNDNGVTKFTPTVNKPVFDLPLTNKAYLLPDNYVNGLWYGQGDLESVISSADPYGDGSLIRKYQFQTNATDTTGNFNATDFGTVDYSNDGFLVGTKSATYNANGDYTDIGTPLSNLNGIYTISFNFYRDGSGGTEERILSNSNGRLSLRVDGNTFRLSIQIASGSTLTIVGGTYTNSTWVNIRIEIEPNVAIRLYANNILIGENLTYTTLYSLFNDSNIRVSIATNWFNGRVSQLEIYNRILTKEESLGLITQEVRSYSVTPYSPQITYAKDISSGKLLGVEVVDGVPVDLHFVEDAPTLVLDSIQADVVIGGNLFGQGQTWQDVTASRSAGVTYTNSTGKPIEVAISIASRISALIDYAYVDGIQVAQIRNENSAVTIQAQWSFVVPNGSTYTTTATSSILYWAELK